MITILFCLSLIIVVYHIKKYSTRPSELSGIPSMPTLSFMWAMITGKPQDEVQEIISKVSNKGIIMADAGTIKYFYIQDADYIKQFLIKSEDVLPKMPHNLGNRVKSFYGNGILFSNSTTWRMQRKLANAAFNRVSSHDVIGDNAFKMFKLMDLNLSKPINIYDMMQRTTIEILGQVAFAYEFGGLKSFETPEIIRTYKYIMEQTESQLHIIFPIVDKLPLKTNRVYREKLNEFDNFILNIIEQKKKELFKFNYHDKEINLDENRDLLMTMLQMSEKEGIKIDCRELRDNLVNFFIAGHDTTSLNISVSVFQLAINPEIQRKAREEVIRVLGDKLVIPNSDQLKELRYINAIIKESLRKYPPLAILIPRTPNDYVQIGPYIIPPNSYNCVNVWHVHHDPKHWKNPHQYDPERFLTNEKRHPYAWIPFSGGPRNCAGQNFSLMEQRIIIAMMLLKYEWSLPEDSIHKEKFCLDSNFLLKPKNLSVEIQFRERL